MNNRPTQDDLLLAAEWLDYNEGGDGESERCARVAEWLRKQVHNRQTAALAKQCGVSRAVVRAAITQVEGK